jgi:radical SAM superfamily enzyme YgiQ (UPF0313 family)
MSVTEPRACNLLMVYPRFTSESFWNFREACELVGAKYPAAPLGLITVAAMLPKSWTVRLVNRNTEELTEEDLAWADMVFTGGMLFQQVDTLAIIEMCHERDIPVAVGGPDATSSPHVYASATYRVLGEAEGVLDQFIAAFDQGSNEDVFEAPKFQADVTKSPVPRFDLLKFDQYLYIGVQFSRGCPFTCEFCDIIELYGRVPRTKTTPQILAELDALYALGYRGHVDFVDDNLIGNKKSIKLFLPHLQKWQEEHDFPFEFSTEASLNLADDDELLAMMKRCNFFAVFVGIESPDEETLKAMRKKQNTRRSIPESVHKIYGAGMFVTAGFIVGFDTERGSVAEGMIELIRDTAIPVSICGLLYALPNTQLTRRLTKEGRLYEGSDVLPSGQGDQTSQGLNFTTLRPRVDILRDFRQVLATVYTPEAYCERIERMVGMLDCSLRHDMKDGDVRQKNTGLAAIHEILSQLPGNREIFWKTFTNCLKKNPKAARSVISLMALYLHLGPFARRAVEIVDMQIRALEAGRYVAPKLLVAPEEPREKVALTA